jgi:phospholipid/cholesterol/gamma-HCH transport system substrate-binding protein
MASKSNIEFRVGITVLLGLIILVVSIYWLQGYKLERNSQSIMVRYRDVGTLAVGDKVTVSGVHRGKVNRMTLTENGVLVELLVYEGVVLKQDATFTIKNLGVMGDRFVAIDPGQDSLRLDTDTIMQGQYDIGIPEVMGRLGEMITELRTLVSALKHSVASDSSLAKFNRTVTNVERLTNSLAEYVERNEGKLDRTADNFLDASRKINRLLARNDELVDSSLQRFNRASSRLEAFTTQLDTLSQTARRFADDDLRQTADNIDDLIQDIRANPEKYIRLKVELF